MRFVLDFLYALGLLIVSPWLIYTVTRGGTWKSVPARFGLDVPAVEPRGIWLHGSSVGEVGLLAPLVRMLEREYPAAPILITSFTDTGVAAARARYPNHCTAPLPFDFSFIARRFLRCVDPRLLVIVESDFWPNLMSQAARQGVPVAVLNAKISARSFGVHRRTGIVPRLLQDVDVVAAQTDEHAERFVALGVKASKVFVTGNMKYDLAEDVQAGDARAAVRVQLSVPESCTVIIGASLHLPEDEAVFDSFVALRAKFPRIALVVVPRYPDEGALMAEHARARGLPAILKSAIDAGAARASALDAVLIADTLGELRSLYEAADIAFVGGSLYFRGANKGGHNLMEPAALGIPVLFGPYNFSFKETVADLLAAEAGVMVASAAELERELARFLTSPDLCKAFGGRARDVILRNKGATARSLGLIAPLLDGATVAGPGATDDNAPVAN